jgi:hypothetical protein
MRPVPEVKTIGRTVADRLGFVDEEITTLTAKTEGVDPELVADTQYFRVVRRTGQSTPFPYLGTLLPHIAGAPS